MVTSKYFRNVLGIILKKFREYFGGYFEGCFGGYFGGYFEDNFIKFLRILISGSNFNQELNLGDI